MTRHGLRRLMYWVVDCAIYTWRDGIAWVHLIHHCLRRMELHLLHQRWRKRHCSCRLVHWFCGLRESYLLFQGNKWRLQKEEESGYCIHRILEGCQLLVWMFFMHWLRRMELQPSGQRWRNRCCSTLLSWFLDCAIYSWPGQRVEVGKWSGVWERRFWIAKYFD